MSEPVFMFDGQDAAMLQASESARYYFKYFWRELSWERRRIVPGLDMAMIKLPFTDGPRRDGKPEHEIMWVAEVDFDGETLSGNLCNSPNWLASVKEGDRVHVPFGQLSDWMMVADGVAYGGFTVNQMRSQMSRAERQQHDGAWGLKFGDPADIRVEIDRNSQSKGGLLAGLFGRKPQSGGLPDGFNDHPMCINMIESIREQLQADASIAQQVDDAGWTLLQREALAGNLGVVQLLVEHGADITAMNPSGRTAADLAHCVGWTEIAAWLDGLNTSPAT